MHPIDEQTRVQDGLKYSPNYVAGYNEAVAKLQRIVDLGGLDPQVLCEAQDAKTQELFAKGWQSCLSAIKAALEANATINPQDSLQEQRNTLPQGWVWLNSGFGSGVFQSGAQCPTGWVGLAKPVRFVQEPSAAQVGEGCEYCQHPLFAATHCKNCGRRVAQVQLERPQSMEARARKAAAERRLKDIEFAEQVLGRVQAYMRQHNCSFNQAYEAVRAQYLEKPFAEKAFPANPTVYRYHNRQRSGLPLIMENTQRGNFTPRRDPEIKEFLRTHARRVMVQTSPPWSQSAFQRWAVSTLRELGLLGQDDNVSHDYIRKVVKQVLRESHNSLKI